MGEIKKHYSKDKLVTTYKVMDEHSGTRLDHFMQNFAGTLSREFMKNKIKKGEIVISDRKSPHRPNSKVYSGEVVTMTTYRGIYEDEYWNGEKVIFKENPEEVFEDADLLVISKPPFMSTHPTGRHIFYCANVVMEGIKNYNTHSVHRLDRETSGLLLLAKNPKMAQELSVAFEKQQVKKVYFFIAHIKDHAPNVSSFLANERLDALKEGNGRLRTLVYPHESNKGKTSETKFQVLARSGQYAVALAFPQSGRQHQIRAHADHYGLPLVGDKIYTDDHKVFGRFKDGIASKEDHESMELPRQALHAIGINIPYKGERKTLICSIPHDFQNWFEEKNLFDMNLIEQKMKKSIEDYFTFSDK